jgi:hypothetical protein
MQPFEEPHERVRWREREGRLIEEERRAPARANCVSPPPGTSLYREEGASLPPPPPPPQRNLGGGQGGAREACGQL